MPLCSLEQNHLANQGVSSPKVERRMAAPDFSLILESLPLTSGLNWALAGLHVLGALHGVYAVPSWATLRGLGGLRAPIHMEVTKYMCG